MKASLRNIPLLIIPFGCYVFYSFYLKTWIIDDAGISFAYAKNLANGYGLTSWPGEKTVEGFSNFLWMLLMSALHLINLFDPTYTPKILAGILMLGSFYLINQSFLKTTGTIWTGILVNVFIATNAPIVIWTQSGLENALYAFLILLLGREIIMNKEPTIKWIALLSFITFLIAITRPEGCMYFVVYPATLIISRSLSRRKIVLVIYYTLFFMLTFSSFLLFRFLYFHELVPNTYYAKYESIYEQSKLIAKLEYLSYAIGGRWGKYLILLNFISVIYIWIRGIAKSQILKIYTILFLLGFINFLVLPNDWMGELRFATPFIIFFYCWFVFQCHLLYIHFCEKSTLKKTMSIASFILVLIYSGYHFHLRLITFGKDPTVPFSEIKALYVDKFNTYSTQLKLPNATVFLPDVGASLYYSNIKVYDAAGLCDKTIAKNIGHNRMILLDYVFEELKPTFIHLHLKWADLYKLHEDTRFAKYYVPLYEKTEILKDNEFYTNTSGDFLRRDAINIQNQAIYDSLFLFSIQ